MNPPKKCPGCGAGLAIPPEWFLCSTRTSTPTNSSYNCLTRQRDALAAHVKRLEDAGDRVSSAADAAWNDIREHLQVANYNLHGKLNTGDYIEPPRPPVTIHQAGIDASQAVNKRLLDALAGWTKAKEAKP